MHSLERHTLETIRAYDLLEKGDRVLVGVSGGPDSMALLQVLANLAGELGVTLKAIYVDHGLRPEETGAEAELARTAAGRLGVEFVAGAVDVRGHAEAEGVSLEAAARKMRYDLFEAEAAGAVIAVGHTADDQAEETLLRLVRGSGRNGLAGMGYRNYRGVIRPFLEVAKAEILAYLEENRIGFLEDSSNRERDFLRNRVRLDLLPFLEEHFNPAVRDVLRRTGEILGAEDELLDSLADDFYRQAVSVGEEGVKIDIPILLDAHPALGRRVVERALAETGTTPSFQQIDGLLLLAGRQEGGGELHLSGGLRVTRTGEALVLSYPAGRKPHRLSLAAAGEVSFEVSISGPGSWPLGETGISLELEVTDELPDRRELMRMEADYLDLSSVTFPLTARPPKPGDRFHPLGAPGSRKVADFLSDRKVPRQERGRVPVLEDRQGIVALVGRQVDDRCRLVDSTSKVLKVRLLSG